MSKAMFQLLFRVANTPFKTRSVSRSRLCKVGLQRLANITGLQIQVSHFPPGISKWTRIEHSLFPHFHHSKSGGKAFDQMISCQTIIDPIDLIAHYQDKT